jgi:hypothetical protein
MSILASRATKRAAILAATPCGLARFWLRPRHSKFIYGAAKIGTAQRVFCHVTDSENQRYASNRPHAITPIHIMSDSAACSFAEDGVATPAFQLATDRYGPR